MTQFHEGQDVEVNGIWFKPGQTSREVGWRKAKYLYPADGIIDHGHHIAFLDGSRGVFDETHIRRHYDLTAEDVGLLHDDIAPEG